MTKSNSYIQFELDCFYINTKLVHIKFRVNKNNFCRKNKIKRLPNFMIYEYYACNYIVQVFFLYTFMNNYFLLYNIKNNKPTLNECLTQTLIVASYKLTQLFCYVYVIFCLHRIFFIHLFYYFL